MSEKYVTFKITALFGPEKSVAWLKQSMRRNADVYEIQVERTAYVSQDSVSLKYWTDRSTIQEKERMGEAERICIGWCGFYYYVPIPGFLFCTVDFHAAGEWAKVHVLE